MDMNVLAAVAIIWTLAAVTPGPNFFITVHTAIGAPDKYSFYTVLGIVVGTLVWAISGFLGISLLFKTVPILYFSLKVIGGLYLVYVGLKLIWKQKNQQVRDSGKYHSPLECFRLGLLTNLLNPKTAAFMTSLFAATIPAEAPMLLGVTIVALICSISTVWYLLVAALFTHNLARVNYEKHKRKIERLAGAIFIGFGLKLALSK